jgi:hypothetical protein
MIHVGFRYSGLQALHTTRAGGWRTLLYIDDGSLFLESTLSCSGINRPAISESVKTAIFSVHI